MHCHSVTRYVRQGHERDDRGTVAIIIALTLTSLLIVTAMVLDFGLVRIDRQVDQSAADAAASAGMYRLSTTGPKTYPYMGICAAIQYLAQNSARFAGITDTAGTWTDGASPSSLATDQCSTPSSAVCTPGDPTSWRIFTWNGTWQGAPLQVAIQSGYQMAGSGWAEDSLAAAAADQSDGAQGCGQLAVTITQDRKPGLGSLATSSDLVTSVRSVARVERGPGGYAPAMLLLKRTGCSSLQVGSTAGSSWVKVMGKYTTNASQPGTIHADADGLNCSSSVYFGKAASGIVAYAAPLASGAPDPSKPGQITSVAAASGLPSSDSVNNVYGSDQLSGTGGTHSTVTGRPLVTRMPVDNRYLAAVRGAVTLAQSSVFGSGLTATNAPAAGYDVATCSPTGAINLPPTMTYPSLYVSCGNATSVTGSLPILYQSVVFSGTIDPANAATISMPNAQHVYVFGITGTTGDAITLQGTGKLSVHAATANLDPVSGQCQNQVVTGSKAVVLVRNGDLKQTGGSLQLCNTTMIMMGGQADACLPASYSDTSHAPPPTSTPCGGGTSMGNGQIKQTGGNVDWTAPNVLDATMDSDGNPLPAALTDWADSNGPEDLALWDESYGTPDNSAADSMAGGGTFHLQGIFMVPNADPFSLTGTSTLVLNNAQFVVTSLKLASNNTTLQMTVDPNSAVTMPKWHPVGVVR